MECEEFDSDSKCDFEFSTIIITDWFQSLSCVRDIVDLVGDHLDLFRRIQAVIGVDVMLTLSSEERNERLKYHLLNSKELHPALVSPESEYKV